MSDILVVNRDPAARLILPELIHRHLTGAEVRTRESATAAAADLEDSRIDVVVTEFELQDLDGLTFLREVKTYRPEAAVLFIGGQTVPSRVRLALNAGAYGLVPLPFECEIFLDLLRRSVAVNRLARSARAAQLRLERLTARIEALQAIIKNASGRPVPFHRPDVAARVLQSRRRGRMTLQTLHDSLGVLIQSADLCRAHHADRMARLADAYRESRRRVLQRLL